MAKYRGIVEDQDFNQYDFQIDISSSDIKEIKAEAIRKVAYDHDKKYEGLQVLVCVEMLTQEQADIFEKDHTTVAELEAGDKFRFQDLEYEVLIPYGESTDEFGRVEFKMMTTNEEVFYSPVQPVERV